MTVSCSFDPRSPRPLSKNASNLPLELTSQPNSSASPALDLLDDLPALQPGGELIGAHCLVSGERVVNTRGSVVDGIYATRVIPSVFPPIERKGGFRRRKRLLRMELRDGPRGHAGFEDAAGQAQKPGLSAAGCWTPARMFPALLPTSPGPSFTGKRP